MMHFALDIVSACASVLATINSTPCSPDAIMLLTALPPAPPTPNTIMRAFISRMSVMLVIFASQVLPQAENERTSIATQRHAHQRLPSSKSERQPEPLGKRTSGLRQHCQRGVKCEPGVR